MQRKTELEINCDNESNPGPDYVTKKMVQGSFNQGNQRFGRSTGIYCACNSLYTLCWSSVRKVCVWNILDFIVY